MPLTCTVPQAAVVPAAAPQLTFKVVPGAFGSPKNSVAPTFKVGVADAVEEKLMPGEDPAALICKPVPSSMVVPRVAVPPTLDTWIFGATTGTAPPSGSVSVTFTVPKPVHVSDAAKVVLHGSNDVKRLIGLVPAGRTGVVVKTPGFVPAAEGFSPVVLVCGGRK